MKEKLQVFVLSYNRPEYLRMCLTSFLAQSLEKIRITVLDNASTFDVAALVRSLSDPRVDLVVNPSNLGAVGNFLRARELASHRYTMIFHDDDCMHPQMLPAQLAILEAEPHMAFVATGVNIVETDVDLVSFATATGVRFELFQNPGELLEAYLSRRAFGFGATMYRTEILKAVEPESEKFRNVLDRPYLLALSEQGTCAYLESPTYNARLHANQDSYTRAWPYIHELDLHRRYLDVSQRYGRGHLKSRIMKLAAREYATRLAPPPVAEWIVALKERDMLEWHIVAVWGPYYRLRHVLVRVVKRWMPSVYAVWRRFRSQLERIEYPAAETDLPK